jgi:hypothetical protein
MSARTKRGKTSAVKEEPEVDNGGMRAVPRRATCQRDAQVGCGRDFVWRLDLNSFAAREWPQRASSRPLPRLNYLRLIARWHRVVEAQGRACDGQYGAPTRESIVCPMPTRI